MKRRKVAYAVLLVIVAAGLAISYRWLSDARQGGTAGRPASAAPATKPPAAGTVSNGPSAFPLPDTSDMQRLSEYRLAQAQLKSEVPVHPWQLKRIENVGRESIPELIAHLGEFDDYMPADVSVGGTGSSLGSPEFANQLVIRLARVRRLLEEGRRNPEAVIGPLREAFEENLDRYPEAERELLELLDRGPVVDRGESSAHVARVTVLVATYVLSELGDQRALPLMLKAYKHHEQYSDVKGLKRPPKQAPAAPATLLYGMHRLIAAAPEQDSNPEAREARTAYLTAASAVLPDVQTLEVTSWNAQYDSFDPRIQAMKPLQGSSEAILQGQPTEEVVLWPWKDKAGTSLSDFNGTISPAAHDLLDKAERYIRLAFPDECKDF